MDSESERVPYELCVHNTFVEKRVVAVKSPRRKSAPTVLIASALVSADIGGDEKRQAGSAVPPLHSKDVCKEVCAGITEVPTTDVKMFIGNVPPCVTSERMQLELKSLGFSGTFTCINFPLKTNVITRGYGFVTFKHQCDAVRFASTFNDYRFEVNGAITRKRCYVKHARGRQA
eukprot:TRINITY_DN12371_c0_g1_i1.p1 TRINITY_DN12371_c0_g1~~TRINITY_DN12371_c0_g1_i1.p1  ORF type:complete len:192 (-),score=16.50 TRINITY_DN12371_c0_g1_i1:318-839(-)